MRCEPLQPLQAGRSGDPPRAHHAGAIALSDARYHSDFLSDLFGSEFQPLHKVFNELGYPAGNRKSVTAWELELVEFWVLHRRAKRLSEVRAERKAA